MAASSFPRTDRPLSEVTGFALVHGAWHGAWFLEPLADELRRRGHRAVAVELPGDDPDAGFSAYVETILEASADLGDRLAVVGHSLGGLTIPLVCARRPVSRLVFLCAAIPRPGISFVAQLERESIFSPGFGGAPQRDDQERSHWPDPEQAVRDLYPDCPPELGAWAAARLRPQGRRPNVDPCPLDSWPSVPSSYVLARGDGVIDPDWSRPAARDRLAVEPIELKGGHSAPLAQADRVADALIAAVAS
jgi:pimeloyl-ACP methyl ester carboxylesterase